MAQKKPRPANTKAHQRYLNDNRWLKNKLRKLEKYISENPNDTQAANRLTEIQKSGGNYNRNKVSSRHTWSPGDMFYAAQCASVNGSVQHYLRFGGNIEKTPRKPDWVETLSVLRRKPVIKTKRRGHRRVKP